ncbi:ATP18, subunit J of the mitochondrial F1F0 ATP synthase [Serpula lacrymans var. lacrymans S7.3]|uniref:ATP18, subunit J of the mitochondrial F1F0 ATP synthase n=2 Tax=Serpula lacrymans var. lacrymans TaxID=341189 RepID=F8Q8B4_SERL3|nr:uncharacterized protein SERLADRAFT_410752 [Serpula lacrymans var. lacrymans S7.9]EGN95802.1 ATP18, subunit J of the mitochondrial F1F0 ATP synthase [Serpula lacrymans var. lacrymans S7.3]EGO21323.1 hypothetical protein SERLADRAFT_410752 [Serpula lacrymans var. lacrymans S7.9]
MRNKSTGKPSPRGQARVGAGRRGRPRGLARNRKTISPGQHPTSTSPSPVTVLRPMWPFFAASSITFYLVSKMQDMGVRSEEYAKDPRNPYVAQIAKEAHH